MARGARRDERARRGTPKPDLAGATLGDDTDAATERARIKRRVRRCGDDATADATCRFYSEELARMVTTRGAVETT
jgi:hypothetical protein